MKSRELWKFRIIIIGVKLIIKRNKVSRCETILIQFAIKIVVSSSYSCEYISTGFTLDIGGMEWNNNLETLTSLIQCSYSGSIWNFFEVIFSTFEVSKTIFLVDAFCTWMDAQSQLVEKLFRLFFVAAYNNSQVHKFNAE